MRVTERRGRAQCIFWSAMCCRPFARSRFCPSALASAWRPYPDRWKHFPYTHWNSAYRPD